MESSLEPLVNQQGATGSGSELLVGSSLSSLTETCEALPEPDSHKPGIAMFGWF